MKSLRYVRAACLWWASIAAVIAMVCGPTWLAMGLAALAAMLVTTFFWLIITADILEREESTICLSDGPPCIVINPRPTVH